MGFEGNTPAANEVKIVMKLTVCFPRNSVFYIKCPKLKGIISPKGCHVVVIWHSTCLLQEFAFSYIAWERFKVSYLAAVTQSCDNNTVVTLAKVIIFLNGNN